MEKLFKFLSTFSEVLSQDVTKQDFSSVGYALDLHLELSAG